MEQFADRGLPGNRVRRKIGGGDDQRVTLPHRARRMRNVGIQERIDTLKHFAASNARTRQTTTGLALVASKPKRVAGTPRYINIGLASQRNGYAKR